MARRWAVATIVAMLATVVAGGPAVGEQNEAPGAATTAATIAVGGSHTCVVLVDHTVRCWGANSSGQLGLGTTDDRGDSVNEVRSLPAVALGAGRTATAVTAGATHSCALLDNGQVKCWGANGLGQLGAGDTTIRGDGAGEMGNALPAVALGTGRTATAIAAGGGFTCALLDNGQVKCWGSNATGQLGLGDTANRGDSAGEMGDSLPAVSLGSGRTAVAVTAGADDACALLDNGQVKCWGGNSVGRLGLGDTNPRGDNAGEMGDSLAAVSLGAGRTAVAVTAGSSHTCALLDNAQVKCWGANNVGQLGLGNTTARGDNAGEMGDSLPAVSLGTARTATGLTAGDQHTCAVLDNGQLKCWGANSSGRLGVGDASHRGDGAGEMGDSLPAVALGSARTAHAVSAGTNHTCAVLDDATVKCWGDNDNGRLGQGHVANIGDGAAEMGDALQVSIQLRAAVRVTLTAEQAAVTAGDQIDYDVVVLNTGGINLSSIFLSAPMSNGCTSELGTLAPGSAISVACSRLTDDDDVPQASNQVQVTTAQGAAALSTIVRTRVDPEGAPHAAVAATVTADQASVIAGAAIDYHVTVANAGDATLTGVTVVAPDVADCAGPVANVAVGAQVVVDCSYTTTAADVPLMTNQVQVTTNQGATALSGTRRTPVAAVRHRPDGMVTVGAGAFLGDDTYNTAGTGQTKAVRVPNRGSATFVVRAQNDGNVVDDLSFLGQGSTNRYSVTYRDGTTNVTAQVLAGTFTVEDLPPGFTHDLTVVVRAKPGTPRGAAIGRILNVRSGAEPSIRDVVKVSVTRS
jgi:uncharacterized repeat protein (TIGR01451 family)